MSTSPIRSTQRAPKACAACSKRKIRCDKRSPCNACTARGIAASCHREVVRVKGQVLSTEIDRATMGYDELLQENRQLQARLSQRGTRKPSTSEYSPRRSFDALDKKPETLERQVFEHIGDSPRRRAVFSEADIVKPSRELANRLVDHAVQWTFWLHFAMPTHQFQVLHQSFWSRDGGDSMSLDAEYLDSAIYYSALCSALLFVGPDDYPSLGIPGLELESLQVNWYDTALFFLDQADFLCKPDLRTVQTIAILNLVFNNFGDIARHSILWSVAIRQAQQLQLGDDFAHEGESLEHQQTRRRLWWELVLCEWMPRPYRSPCVNESDFNCQLPAEISDDELAVILDPSRLPRSKARPVRYHIEVIKVSRIYYRLRSTLRLSSWDDDDVASLVFSADEELASLIDDLPSYLHPNEPTTPSTFERELESPWIPWQKRSLSTALLYHRMAIGRLLYERWHDGTTVAARSHAICMSSARGLISITLTSTVEASKLRSWFSSLNVFSAAAILISGSKEHDHESAAYVQQAVRFLNGVQAQNFVAQHALQALRRLEFSADDSDHELGIM